MLRLEPRNAELETVYQGPKLATSRVNMDPSGVEVTNSIAHSIGKLFRTNQQRNFSSPEYYTFDARSRFKSSAIVSIRSRVSGRN
jgi:hypothetical protein